MPDDSRSELEIREEKREKAWIERISQPVQEHKKDGSCGEPGCGAPLRSLEEAIAHFESVHRVSIDVRWTN